MSSIFENMFTMHNLLYTIPWIALLCYWIYFCVQANVYYRLRQLSILHHGKFRVYCGLGKIPFVLWLTIVITAILVINVVSDMLIGTGSETPFRFIGGLLIGGGIACFIVNSAAQKLEVYFRKEKSTVFDDLIGGMCIITSSRVDMKFGLAEVKTHEAPLIINVRAKEEEMLVKGDEAVIFAYDSSDNVFDVCKYDI